MITGFDCFSPVTKQVADKAVAAGMEFVCRYYGSPGSRKLLLPPEVEVLKEASLRLFPVFERTPGRPLDGSQAGREDATLAMQQAAVVKQPFGTAICFAVDQDVDLNRPVIKNLILGYFSEIKTGLAGKYIPAAYGSGAVLDYLLAENLIQVAWLAGAMGWQGSRQFDAKAHWHMKQYPTVSGSSHTNKLGIDYDPNEAISWEKVYAWDLGSIKPEPGQESKEDTGPINLFELQRQLKEAGFYKAQIDGTISINGPTVRALVAYSKANPPK